MEKIYKIIKVFPIEEGISERGRWRSQDVVVQEVNDEVEHPNELLLRCRGSLLERFTPVEGLLVSVKFSTSVRYYTTGRGTAEERERASMEANCWKMELREESDKIIDFI